MIEKIFEEIIYNVSLTDLQRAQVKQILQKYKAQEQKWISVEDRLPEDDANVLAFIKYVMVDGTCVGEENTMCDVTWYNPSSKRWFLPGLKEAEVKAWMQIPEYHFANADKKIGRNNG